MNKNSNLNKRRKRKKNTIKALKVTGIVVLMTGAFVGGTHLVKHNPFDDKVITPTIKPIELVTSTPKPTVVPTIEPIEENNTLTKTIYRRKTVGVTFTEALKNENIDIITLNLLANTDSVINENNFNILIQDLDVRTNRGLDACVSDNTQYNGYISTYSWLFYSKLDKRILETVEYYHNLPIIDYYTGNEEKVTEDIKEARDFFYEFIINGKTLVYKDGTKISYNDLSNPAKLITIMEARGYFNRYNNIRFEKGHSLKRTYEILDVKYQDQYTEILNSRVEGHIKTEEEPVEYYYDEEGYAYYTLRSNDTFKEISRMFYGTKSYDQKLQEYNQVPYDLSKVEKRRIIVIPPKDYWDVKVTEEPTIEPMQYWMDENGFTHYIIRSVDSLKSIAKQFYGSEEYVYVINYFNDDLYVGKEIILPSLEYYRELTKTPEPVTEAPTIVPVTEEPTVAPVTEEPMEYWEDEEGTMHYILRSVDTKKKVAKFFYGNEKYTYVIDYFNGTDYYVGQEIVLPPLEKYIELTRPTEVPVTEAPTEAPVTEEPTEEPFELWFTEDGMGHYIFREGDTLEFVSDLFFGSKDFVYIVEYLNDDIYPGKELLVPTTTMYKEMTSTKEPVTEEPTLVPVTEEPTVVPVTEEPTVEPMEYWIDEEGITHYILRSIDTKEEVSEFFYNSSEYTYVIDYFNGTDYYVGQEIVLPPLEYYIELTKTPEPTEEPTAEPTEESYPEYWFDENGYGYYVYRGFESLEDISNIVYGDSNYADYIRQFNQIIYQDGINKDDIVYIPNLLIFNENNIDYYANEDGTYYCEYVEGYTLERIAFEVYGDFRLASFIKEYNGIEDIEFIEDGTIINLAPYEEVKTLKR